MATSAAPQAALPTGSTRLGDRTVAPGILVALLGGWLALDNILLWRFLGLISTGVTALLALLVAGLVIWIARRVPDRGNGPTLRLLAFCAGIALVVFLLGGEGRFFYATTDWQVRGAVLRDMALNPWPFVYDVAPSPQMLRAPLGMYLAPAAVGRVGGQYAAELALLVQNSLILAAILALGATLFSTTRARVIALTILIGFSGLDAMGQVLAGQPISWNAERWSVAVYSSHISQLFWTPPHCLAGWIGALLYLLWRDNRLTLAGFLTPLPLLALWSPLSLIGLMPFAAHAGIEALRKGSLNPAAVIAPAAATLMAIPALLYLATGSDAVGGSAAALPLHQYIVFEICEVDLYLLPLWFIGRNARFGGATLAIVTLVLLVVPYGQVGQSNDFTMRASIPALVVLAFAVADQLVKAPSPGKRLWWNLLVASLAIGAITPAFEIWRAVTLPRAPHIRCSYFGVVPGGYMTYVAPLSRAPSLIAPRDPARFRPDDRQPCWDGPWPGPQLFIAPERH
ncbi:hypothetical protein [Sphingomonas sp. NIBR02145]|uniref:hypothetical protein n=1 Tax=Sphingomonas sp. NIBR02145 TaxID=3014784 RepID=UPI0022B40C0F|nr:hypothetical protein [Sphingomonas sp. NIBR02145]WHU01085.1 hypothetical protein O3305_12770 [Sphingomonas sp. NIBR02145]